MTSLRPTRKANYNTQPEDSRKNKQTLRPLPKFYKNGGRGNLVCLPGHISSTILRTEAMAHAIQSMLICNKILLTVKFSQELILTQPIFQPLNISLVTTETELS